jgi:hypothetical protein
VEKLRSSLNKNVTTARVTSGKVEVILNKNVTIARVPSGKVEVIIKQKSYYSKGC